MIERQPKERRWVPVTRRGNPQYSLGAPTREEAQQRYADYYHTCWEALKGSGSTVVDTWAGSGSAARGGAGGEGR